MVGHEDIVLRRLERKLVEEMVLLLFGLVLALQIVFGRTDHDSLVVDCSMNYDVVVAVAVVVLIVARFDKNLHDYHRHHVGTMMHNYLSTNSFV